MPFKTIYNNKKIKEENDIQKVKLKNDLISKVSEKLSIPREKMHYKDYIKYKNGKVLVVELNIDDKVNITEDFLKSFTSKNLIISSKHYTDIRKRLLTFDIKENHTVIYFKYRVIE